MPSIPYPEQLHGCVLGLALGDVLGAAVEALPPAVAGEYATGLSETTVPLTGPGGWAIGQVTDDTQLSRILLESIVEQGGFDPALFAARLQGFVESGRLVGGGRATLGTARQLARGVPWHQCGMPSPYAGNGAAMRAGPLGLIYRDDHRQLTRVVVDQARVTHHDPRAIAGAVAVAWAVAIASRQAPIDPRDFLVEIAAATEPVDPGFSVALVGLSEWIHLPPSAVAEAMVREGLEPESADGWQGISSYVVSSVCWSLFAFLRHPEEWWDAVRVAIAVGGDTDTIASMTGAISGARLGARGLPRGLFSRISDAGEGVAEELSDLSDRVRRLVVQRK